MRKNIRVILAAMALAATVQTAAAQRLSMKQNSEILRATPWVIVNWNDQLKTCGTAFCINSKEGLFLTHARVAQGFRMTQSSDIELVYGNPEDSDRRAEAKVVLLDTKMGLALLQAKFDSEPAALSGGSSNSIDPKEKLWLAGFAKSGTPVVASLGDLAKTKLTISPVGVAGLRWADGSVRSIQLGSRIRGTFLRPANTGGPLLDSQSRVVGLVECLVKGKSNYRAIPSGSIRAFLDKPDVKVDPPQVTKANQSNLLPFRIRVTGVRNPKTEYDVTLRLLRRDQWEEIPLARKGTSYEASIVPVKPITNDDVIRVKALFEDGHVSFRTKDIDLSAGGERFRLSEVDQAAGGDEQAVRLRNGKGIEGFPAAFRRLSGKLGDRTNTFDLSQARRLIVDTPALLRRVTWFVEVSKGGHVYFARGGHIDIKGMERGSDEPATTQLKRETLMPLDSWPDRVVRAGGDRYLLLQLGKKVLKFDAVTGKLTEFMELPLESCALTAGRSVVLVADSKSGLFQRYDLKTGKKQKSGMSPWQEPIHAIGMGFDSDTAAFVVTGKGRYRGHLLDVKTLADMGKSTPISSININTDIDEPFLVVSDPRGKSVSFRKRHAYFRIRRKGGGIRSERGSMPWRIPDPEGYQLNSTHLYNRLGQRLRPAKHLSVFVHCLHSKLVLGRARRFVRTGLDRVFAGGWYVMNRNDCDPLALVSAIKHRPGMLNTAKNSWQFMMADDSVLVRVQTDGNGKQHLYALPIDLHKILRNSDQTQFLFVDPKPIAPLRHNKRFVHRVRALSGTGIVCMRLVDGPSGMRMDPDGTLTWWARKPSKDSSVLVQVVISDGYNRKKVHTLRLPFEEATEESSSSSQ
jgi:hypothetical protein